MEKENFSKSPFVCPRVPPFGSPEGRSFNTMNKTVNRKLSRTGSKAGDFSYQKDFTHKQRPYWRICGFRL